MPTTQGPEAPLTFEERMRGAFAAEQIAHSLAAEIEKLEEICPQKTWDPVLVLIAMIIAREATVDLPNLVHALYIMMTPTAGESRDRADA